MNRNQFKGVIKSIVEEMIENNELEEATVTGDVQGYSTPFAFSGDKGSDKKKRKKYSTNSTGYTIVKELVKEILEELRRT